MSVFTTEVRYIAEVWSGLQSDESPPSMDDIIQAALPKIFNFTFPIWDTAYTETLEKKILEYYWFREIGFETPALWRHFLNRKLNTIMPYYVELHKSIEADYNFLEPYDMKEEVSREITGEGTNSNTTTHDVTDTSSSTGSQNAKLESSTNGTSGGFTNTDTTKKESGQTINSDLPQALSAFPNADYATSSSQTENDATNTERVTNDAHNESSRTDTDESTSNTSANAHRDEEGTENGKFQNTSTESLTTHKHGNPGVKTYTQLVQEFREAILNVDRLIIEDLEPLFMGLWE